MGKRIVRYVNAENVRIGNVVGTRDGEFHRVKAKVVTPQGVYIFTSGSRFRVKGNREYSVSLFGPKYKVGVQRNK